MNKQRVLLAMSGGIDSTVAAILLQEQGYELVGITYRAYDSISTGCLEKETGCCSIDSIMEAKHVAQNMGFEHHILDLRESFDEIIISDFLSEYLKGRTPNPCVLCNSVMKWGKLLRKADELKCDFIATGHYANINQLDGRYYLSKGEDLTKDQTYFLWTLTQEGLSRTLFPLGKYQKNEIREIARNHGLVKLAEKKESQEICFIPDNNYRRFINERAPEFAQTIGKGNFVDVNGKIIGTHNGFPFYTVGQRKGLNIALGYPAYVTKIESDKNEIVIGKREDLLKNYLWLTNLNLMKYNQIPFDKDLTVKIRYNNKGALCRMVNDNGRVKVEFYENVSAIAPGQSAVVYDGNDVIAGGIIEIE